MTPPRAREDEARPPRRRRTALYGAVGGAGTAVAVLVALAVAGAPPFDNGPAPLSRKGTGASTPPQPPAAAVLKPHIVSRAQWGADSRILDQKPHYADAVRAVVIHHTDNPNTYSCADSPALVRDIYRAHAVGRGWGDIGYNFLVDKCGTVFEGRLGGVDRPVIGAHTVGLNKGTTGIAAIGTYTEGVPVPQALRRSVERIIAWKLGLSGVAPAHRTQLVSTNSDSRFPKDSAVNVPTVLGHIEAYETDCPGEALMRLLPTFRKDATLLQSKARVLAQSDEGQGHQGNQGGTGGRGPAGAPERTEERDRPGSGA